MKKEFLKKIPENRFFVVKNVIFCATVQLQPSGFEPTSANSNATALPATLRSHTRISVNCPLYTKMFYPSHNVSFIHFVTALSILHIRLIIIVLYFIVCICVVDVGGGGS